MTFSDVEEKLRYLNMSSLEACYPTAVIDSIKSILREAGETTIELVPDYQAMIDNSPVVDGEHVGQYGRFGDYKVWYHNSTICGHLTGYGDKNPRFRCKETGYYYMCFIPMAEPVDLDPITLKPVKK